METKVFRFLSGSTDYNLNKALKIMGSVISSSTSKLPRPRNNCRDSSQMTAPHLFGLPSGRWRVNTYRPTFNVLPITLLKVEESAVLHLSVPLLRSSGFFLSTALNSSLPQHDEHNWNFPISRAHFHRGVFSSWTYIMLACICHPAFQSGSDGGPCASVIQSRGLWLLYAAAPLLHLLVLTYDPCMHACICEITLLSVDLWL